jgi:subtilisin family serine protease
MAYLKRVHNFLEAGRRDTSRKIKVAVLDTGIAYEHPDIAEQRARIVKDRDWTSSGIDDEVGHGTHIAALLLKVAPAAHIYIAKVFKSAEAVPQTADYVSSVREH